MGCPLTCSKVGYGKGILVRHTTAHAGRIGTLLSMVSQASLASQHLKIVGFSCTSIRGLSRVEQAFLTISCDSELFNGAGLPTVQKRICSNTCSRTFATFAPRLCTDGKWLKLERRAQHSCAVGVDMWVCAGFPCGFPLHHPCYVLRHA